MKPLLTPYEERRFIRMYSWREIYKELCRKQKECILKELERRKDTKAKVRFLEDLFNATDANVERLKDELFYEEELRDFVRGKLKEVEEAQEHAENYSHK